jgi:hypothetical protein
MFLPGLHDQATVKEIISSSMWPVFVQAYNLSNQKVRVGLIKRSTLNLVSAIDVVDQYGLRIGSVSVDGGAMHFGVYNNPTAQGVPGDQSWSRVKSTNVKYIVRKLKDGNSDASRGLTEGLETSDGFFNKTIWEMVHDALNHGRSFRDREIHVSVPSELATMLLRVFKGDMDRHTVGTMELAAVDTLFEQYCRKRDGSTEAFLNTCRLFGGEKWIFLPDICGGVLVAAINKQPIIDLLNRYRATDSFPTPASANFVHYSVEPCWYKSMDDVPENYRRDIEMQLTMLKLHRRSEKMIPEMLEENVSNGTNVYFDVGAAFHISYGDNPIILLDKSL